MRNPDRIPKVLNAVEQKWEERPDLRLGQLLYVICGGDPFNVEDSDLMAKMDEEMKSEEFIEDEINILTPEELSEELAEATGSTAEEIEEGAERMYIAPPKYGDLVKPRILDPPCLVGPDHEAPMTIEIPICILDKSIMAGVVAERISRKYGYRIVDIDDIEYSADVWTVEVTVTGK